MHCKIKFLFQSFCTLRIHLKKVVKSRRQHILQFRTCFTKKKHFLTCQLFCSWFLISKILTECSDKKFIFHIFKKMLLYIHCLVFISDYIWTRRFTVIFTFTVFMHETSHCQQSFLHDIKWILLRNPYPVIKIMRLHICKVKSPYLVHQRCSHHYRWMWQTVSLKKESAQTVTLSLKFGFKYL